ncbi:MAG: DDE-type integrase/transposase/recombinase [Nanoarchaeota archaeon]
MMETCPKCKSQEIIKWCKRKTENRGLIQRYKCKSCNSYFILDDGFFRMRNTPQKITQSIDLFYRGVSTRKVQEHLAIFHPHNASNVSIYKWVVKYAKMISKYTEKLKANVCEEVQVDEVEFHRRKTHKRKSGAEKNFFVDSICPDTKYLVACKYGRARSSKEIKAVMNEIKDKTDNQIKIVTTDGFNAYKKVVKRVFGYNNKLGRYNVLHNVVNASQGEGFNYPIERLHNSVRARTKVMRGFHGSIHSANAILKGFEVYYNFITKHQAIKKCPYELAIVDEDVKEYLKEMKNRWLGLIYLTKEASL